MIPGDRLGDVLEQDGLAGTRRRDDQATLPLADGREQVHDARGERLGTGLQDNVLVRVDGREVVEIAARIFVGRLSLQVLHLGQARPGAFPGGFCRAANENPFAQPELLDERRPHVGIRRLGRVMPGRIPQKAIALGMELKDALHLVLVTCHWVTNRLSWSLVIRSWQRARDDDR